MPYGRRTYTGSPGQDTVGAGTFWGVLNVSLRASGTQLGLDLTCFMTGNDYFSLLTGIPTDLLDIYIFRLF